MPHHGGVTNDLSDALSPYLQSHASNPVHWRLWGPEAFEEARIRDVPVFLSVGYAACHWCHVMAHESFEDPGTAEVLNRGFVSIKVDREERPDVDAHYMSATTALTGSGGWPMSVWLDHDARPFYAGTYFPPHPRSGLPSFAQVLAAISDAWTTRRDELDAAAGRIAAALRPDGHVPAVATELAVSTHGLDGLLVDAVDRLAQDFDDVSAGFGGAPKFPPSMVLDFLLRHHRRTGDPRALRMVEATCSAMARGGLFDQLGGGFARYSVDRDWVVPHFEKMLYDNALLLGVYTDLFRATGSEFAARVVRQTAEFLVTDLRTGEGGFASALDADSAPADDPAGRPVEGAFYVWQQADVYEALGATDAAWAVDLLQVTPEGTFERGTSTLQLPHEPEDPQRWSRVRAALLTARSKRPPPQRDDKVVAAWNGLAIRSLSEAGVVFDEPAWISAAVGAAELMRDVHWRGGRLSRVSRDGRAGEAPGVLEDYADVTNGLLALYSASGDAGWAAFAEELTSVITAEFASDAGGWRDAPPDAAGLLPPSFDPSDNAYPSGGSAATATLVSVAALGLRLGPPRPSDGRGAGWDANAIRSQAEGRLSAQRSLMARHPRFAGGWLAAAEAVVDGPWQVAVVGDLADPDARELVRAAALAQRPGMVLARGGDSDDVGLLGGRTVLNGHPTAYVCRGFVCDLPVTTPGELEAQLRR